jgi:hypothetical protein
MEGLINSEMSKRDIYPPNRIGIDKGKTLTSQILEIK